MERLNQPGVRRWRHVLFLSVLVGCAVGFRPAAALGQAAAAPGAEPPPPAHEGSAEVAYLATTGNASAQTLGIGGEVIWRPMPWVVRNKAAFLRNKADGVLTAEAFQYLIRGERLLNPRTSVFA